MFCENCGSQIADGSAICPNCGAAVRATAGAEAATPVQPVQPAQPVQPVYQQPIYQQQPAYQQPIYQQPAGGSKALAITALILGICGLVFCWLPIFGMLISVAGLICGIISFKNPNGKGMGITGFILSIIGIIIGLTYTIAIFGSTSFTKSYSSVSRSISRSISRSRSQSLSRSRSQSRSRANRDDIASADSELHIGGYVVTFGE